jgi:hypothetical protein
MPRALDKNPAHLLNAPDPYGTPQVLKKRSGRLKHPRALTQRSGKMPNVLAFYGKPWDFRERSVLFDTP